MPPDDIDPICVLGAGAIGGGIGALLHDAGHPVTLVARGAHLDAMRRDGLRLLTPGGARTVRVPVSDTVPGHAAVVLLAVKGPQLPAALAMVPGGRPVVCLQNGIGSEPRVALAGHPTIGAMVYLPATHLVPGEVRLHGAPHPGVVDLGGFSDGTAPLAELLSARLRAAGLDSVVQPDIMAWKRGKLLLNLAGGLEVACGHVDPALHGQLMGEAEVIYRACGLPWVSLAALRTRSSVESRPAAGLPRAGSSMWQSLTRGRPVEVGAIYDDLIELGRLAGVPAITCARLRAVVAELTAPGGWQPDALRALLLGE